MSQSDTTDFDTLDYYQTVAPSYRGSGAGGINRFLDEFLTRLSPGTRILDLGCGGGRDSAEMMRRGFDVLPCDGSAAIAGATAIRLGCKVHVLRFDELEFHQEFDAVWASASLLHVPRAALPDVLARVHRALRPGGLHLATYKAEGAAGRDSVGRYFNHLSAQDARAAYRDPASWQDLQVESYTGGGYENGAQGPWIKVTARAAG